MKQLSILITILILLLAAVGCGENGTSPPSITNISAQDIGETTTTITWTTDEPASSQVEYGTTDAYGSTSALDSHFVISHSVTLSGLTVETTYHFRVKSRDADGNEAVSTDSTFATPDVTPPELSNVSMRDVAGSSAVITWTTDEPATSQVEYGKNGHYGFTTALDDGLTTNHSVTLTELEQDTAYHFRVKSTDEAGNEATSSDSTFTTSAPLTPFPGMAELSIHFIDVGQGDSILIDLGDIEVLIDGGGKSPGVTSYIDDYVDGALEVMVATHPHADHIGGLIDVLAAFEVQEIWLNGDTSTSKTYSQFMSAVDSEGAQAYEARKGDTIEVGDLLFNVLHPVNLSGTTNNNSIVLSLTYGQVDFLFTGDAEQEAEASILAEGIVPDVEILKVGHHGSRTASSPSFLKAAQPEVAIYMAGIDNRYGHPHEETVTALQAIGASIYGTDVNGTIVVITDGITYEVQTEK